MTTFTFPVRQRLGDFVSQLKYQAWRSEWRTGSALK